MPLRAGVVLVEAHDEWQVSDRRYLSEGSMRLLAPPSTTQATRDVIQGGAEPTRQGLDGPDESVRM